MGGPEDTGGLAEFVSTARAANDKILTISSFGGWSGSRYLTSISKDPAKRKVLVDDITDIYSSFNLDGIELDWEFPGGTENQGAPCNEHDPDDTKVRTLARTGKSEAY